MLCCLALSSCFYSVEEYPKDWPPVKVAETECPDLTGHYEDEFHVLGKSLIGGNDVYRHIFGRPQVSIAGPENGKLHVTVYTGNTLDSERTYVQDEDFKCQEGQLHFSPPGYFIDGGMESNGYGLVTGKGESYWVKAEDGSLLHRSKGFGIGVAGIPSCLCLPIPIAAYEDNWEKVEQVYKPIEQNRNN
jgi:hypothetical protein